MLDQFKATLQLKAVGYACGRKISCGCGKILDQHDAVLCTMPDRAGIDCGDCFDKTVKRLGKKLGLNYNETIRSMIATGVEIDDGRVLRKLI